MRGRPEELTVVAATKTRRSTEAAVREASSCDSTASRHPIVLPPSERREDPPLANTSVATARWSDLAAAAMDSSLSVTIRLATAAGKRHRRSRSADAVNSARLTSLPATIRGDSAVANRPIRCLNQACPEAYVWTQRVSRRGFAEVGEVQ